jgi:hypothetical protein
MKKTFFLFAMFTSVASGAQVAVNNTAVDYAAKKITFTVSWTTTPKNNKIWLFADYRKIENNAETGNWSRAPISAAIKTAGVGSASTVAGNTQGFWLNTSGSSGSATVLVTLAMPDEVTKFNWCAYGSDAPPTAVVNDAGGYTLKGTRPFTINGTMSVNATTFGAGTCIASIIDLTGNPDGITHAIPQATISGAATNPCPATTAVLTAAAANATTFTWYQNGSPVQSGTSTSYTVTATDSYTVQGSNANCTGTASTAKVVTISACTGCVASTLTLTGVGFSSTATYSRNGVMLSSPVTVTTCQKTAYNGGTNVLGMVDCRDNPGYAGTLFSGCMLKQYASQLCPSPWRVPSKSDIEKYGCNTPGTYCNTSEVVAGMHGWEMGGYANGDGSILFPNRGLYWDIDESDVACNCNQGTLVQEAFISANYLVNLLYGIKLRCVQ